MIARTGQDQVIDQDKVLVFDGDINYNLILGADFLAKSSINIKYSSGTLEWFDNELPMQDPRCFDNNEYLAMAESLEVLHRGKNNSSAGTGTIQTALLPQSWMPSMKR